MRYALLAVGMLLTWIAPSFASVSYHLHDASYKMTVPDDVAGVRVDWIKQTVFIVTVFKAPPTILGGRSYQTAFAGALEQARRQVRDGLAGIKLTSYASVKDAVATKVLGEEDIFAASQAVRPVADKWDSYARTLTLLSALPLTGAGSFGEVTAKMLMVEQITYKSNVLQPVLPKETMNLRKHEPISQISDGPYTGLIIDCTGLNYTPALLPKLVAEDGKEFWGTSQVNHLLVMEKGIAEYSKEYKSALNSKRPGDTPLIVRPIGTAGTLRGDLVFSADDARLIEEQNAKSKFLDTLNIVIVLD